MVWTFLEIPPVGANLLTSCLPRPSYGHKRISKRAVDALQCPKGKDRLFLWDQDLKGFGVVAMPSGARCTSPNFGRAADRAA
jgi:hypothetical protein